METNGGERPPVVFVSRPAPPRRSLAECSAPPEKPQISAAHLIPEEARVSCRVSSLRKYIQTVEYEKKEKKCQREFLKIEHAIERVCVWVGGAAQALILLLFGRIKPD